MPRRRRKRKNHGQNICVDWKEWKHWWWYKRSMCVKNKWFKKSKSRHKVSGDLLGGASMKWTGHRLPSKLVFEWNDHKYNFKQVAGDHWCFYGSLAAQSHEDKDTEY